MKGFYIVNKDTYDVLFCKPLQVEGFSDEDVDNNIDMILSFYSKVERSDLFTGIQTICLKEARIVFLSKFSFLFILVNPVTYSEEMITSQLFFYMKLFLNAFDIRDKESAKDLLNELDGSYRRKVSESLTHSFLLWNVLNSHIDDVDKRNMVEVFENVFNSFWDGIRDFDKSSENVQVKALLSTIPGIFEEYLKTDTNCLKNIYDINDNSFNIKKIDNICGITIQIKNELLRLLQFFVEYIIEMVGVDIYRHIVVNNLSTAIRTEWQRLKSLDLIKSILVITWR
ncbi:hypothetical protein ES708_25867 [subsurface metagenome]